MNFKTALHKANLDTFFEIASPTTLASLIADVYQAGADASLPQLELEWVARRVLVANVGPDEAGELIAGGST